MTTTISNTSHDDYQPMLEAVRAQFAGVTGPLFTTTATGRDLWDEWMDDMPEHEKKQHDCHACRRFVETYGGLVRIDEQGVAHPAIFDVMPVTWNIYSDAFQSVAKAVRRARVTGVFVSSTPVWGTPSTRDGKRDCTWHHMHVVPPASMVYRGSILTAGQRAAELGEDYATLSRALAEFTLETVGQALAIAESESLYRSEKIKGRLQWLADLKESRANAKGPAIQNLVWLAVATAPAGFAHVRSSVVGSLLEDIEAGKPFAEVKRAFDAKMSPVKYQRPVAPPSEGNVKQAEAIVEKLASAGALRRRFARLEDVTKLWSPAPPKLAKTAGGVFGHLLPADRSGIGTMVASGPKMTWEKFARTVLPSAEKLEVVAPARGHYTALVTAADPDAPPILQWDREDARNSVSWYTYASGSYAAQWKMSPGAYVPVTAVALMPNMWQGNFEHQGKGVILLMEGCRDTKSNSLSLFPELLKSEYHSIRRSIEAFSQRGKLEGADEATACGLTVRAGAPDDIRIRAHSRGTVTDYVVDRWD